MKLQLVPVVLVLWLLTFSTSQTKLQLETLAQALGLLSLDTDDAAT